MTYPFWMALQSMTHSFLELHKPLCCDRAVIHEEDEPLRSEGVQHAAGEEQRNGSRKKMKRLGQSGKDTPLWIYLVVKLKSDAVKNNTS